MPKRCILGCPYTRDIPNHRFPNPHKRHETFKLWVDIAGRRLESPQDYKDYRQKVICDIHFTENDKNRNKRIKAFAVPTLHLPAVTVHVFPDPKKFPERFKAWVGLVGGEGQKDDYFYLNKRVCDIHFTNAHKNRNRRLNSLAIPCLHLPATSKNKLENVDDTLPASGSRVTKDVSQKTIDVSHERPSVSQETPEVSRKWHDVVIDTQDLNIKRDCVSQVKKYGCKTIQDVSQTQYVSGAPPYVDQDTRNIDLATPVANNHSQQVGQVLSFDFLSPSPLVDEELADDDFIEEQVLDDAIDEVIDDTINQEVVDDTIDQEDTINEEVADDTTDQDEAQEEQLPVICENCNTNVEGFRFVCVSCSGRVVCGACVLGGAHGACYVLRVPPQRPTGEVAAVLRAVRSALAMSMFADQLAEPLAGYDYKCELDLKSETADDDMAPKIDMAALEDDPDDPLAGTSFMFPEVPFVSTTQKAVESDSDTENSETDDDCQVLELAASDSENNVTELTTDTPQTQERHTHVKQIITTNIPQITTKELSEKKLIKVPLSMLLQKVEAKDIPSIKSLEKHKPKLFMMQQKPPGMTTTVDPGSTFTSSNINYQLKPIAGATKQAAPIILNNKLVKFISAVPKQNVNVSKILTDSPTEKPCLPKQVNVSKILIDRPRGKPIENADLRSKPDDEVVLNAEFHKPQRVVLGTTDKSTEKVVIRSKPDKSINEEDVLIHPALHKQPRVVLGTTDKSTEKVVIRSKPDKSINEEDVLIHPALHKQPRVVLGTTDKSTEKVVERSKPDKSINEEDVLIHPALHKRPRVVLGTTDKSTEKVVVCSKPDKSINEEDVLRHPEYHKQTRVVSGKTDKSTEKVVICSKPDKSINEEDVLIHPALRKQTRVVLGTTDKSTEKVVIRSKPDKSINKEDVLIHPALHNPTKVVIGTTEKYTEKVVTRSKPDKSVHEDEVLRHPEFHKQLRVVLGKTDKSTEKVILRSKPDKTVHETEKPIEKVVIRSKPDRSIHQEEVLRHPEFHKQPRVVLERIFFCAPKAPDASTKRKVVAEPSTTPHKRKYKTSPR